MYTRLLHLGIAVLVSFVAPMATAVADSYVCGDADASGGVDIDDVVYLLNYIFAGGPAPDPSVSGDVDASGGVDIDDVVYLMNYIFAGGIDPVCQCEPVTDIDGNVYQTVIIGGQCWMAENLKVTHYRNGDPIPHVPDNSEWASYPSGAYCNYWNKESYVATYGRLYNWYAVDDGRHLAPEGWHVPTDAEWKKLEMYLGMSQASVDSTTWRGTDEGGKLKEVGTSHWYPPNAGATNESGFTGLPGGQRVSAGLFISNRYIGYFWSSTEFSSTVSWERALCNELAQTYRLRSSKNFGYSIRCVRD